MSVPPGSRSGSISGANPGPGGGMSQPQQSVGQGPAGGQHPSSGGQQPQTQQNLNQIVLEYLNKKGFSRSEAMLRKESAHTDAEGRPVITRVEHTGGSRYARAFNLLRAWIEDNLDVYKPELRRLLWPVFVYSVLDLAAEFYTHDCEQFYHAYSHLFEVEHADDLRALRTLRLPEHVEQSTLAKLYRGNRYRLTLTNMAFINLIQYLESKEAEGGAVITSILQNHMHVVHVSRANATERNLAALINPAGADDGAPAEDEGIPGHNPGSANTEPNAPNVLAKLSLGHPPTDPDFLEDVRAQLQEEDAKRAHGPGQPTYVEEFEQRVKRESTEDAPLRDQMPIPPLLARDVAMEVQRVKENRDRFKLEGRTGGVGPGVSVAMYTIMNSNDGVNCIDVSGDYRLIAAGTSQSYVRVWSATGEPLHEAGGREGPAASNSRFLIGHAGPVYSVAFSPSTVDPEATAATERDGAPDDRPRTHARYLLSGAADRTVRLWSLDTWTQLVVYKGHAGPVWDVAWDRWGYYFASASYDRTARLWTTDSITPHRLFVGHENDVDVVAFHPNGAYVFTGAADKTIRMWDSRGHPVRMFTGHAGVPTALAASPDGRSLASADDAGTVIVWSLREGRLVRRLRGHGRGGVWSLAWSVESAVLVSGGADGTVRSWDMVSDLAKDGAGGKALTDVAAGIKVEGGAGAGGAAGTTGGGSGSGTAGAAPASGNGGGAGATGAPNASGGQAGGGAGSGPSGAANKKAKARDNTISPEQISAFPTKKSAVYKVAFTQSNLIIAAGAYLPEVM